MEKTAILGFGNPVRSDDGVGCYVIKQLKQSDLKKLENLSIIDMGTSAFEVLFTLKGHKKMIIVDGVINSGEQDGTLFKLPAKEIHAHIQDDPMVFLHSLKWDQALSYAKKIMGDEFPDDQVIVYLIAISNTKMEIELSPEVATAAHRLVEKIKQDIQPD